MDGLKQYHDRLLSVLAIVREFAEDGRSASVLDILAAMQRSGEAPAEETIRADLAFYERAQILGYDSDAKVWTVTGLSREENT